MNGDQNNDNALDSGAAYVFVRSGGIWTQQTYLKASNTDVTDNFGWSLALSSDTLVVGSYEEDSAATGVNGNQSDNSEPNSGAAYVFVRTDDTWTQQAYLKASNAWRADAFAHSLALVDDMLLIGAPGEDSDATGVNGDQSNNNMSFAGAAYLFERTSGNWIQRAYIKASNPGADEFAFSVALSTDALAAVALFEDSAATGVNGNQFNNMSDDSGAAYAFSIGIAQLLGDMNCDGVASVGDIAGFVLALTDPAAYAAQYPNCNINNADLNDNGVISVTDIGPFVQLLTGG